MDTPRSIGTGVSRWLSSDWSRPPQSSSCCLPLKDEVIIPAQKGVVSGGLADDSLNLINRMGHGSKTGTPLHHLSNTSPIMGDVFSLHMKKLFYGLREALNAATFCFSDCLTLCLLDTETLPPPSSLLA